MSRKQITQKELKALLELDGQIAAAKLAVASLSAQRTELSESVLSMLDAGLPVGRGKLALKESIKPGQRRPRWKAVYTEMAGAGAAEKIIAETAPGPSKRDVVVVS